MVLDDIHNLNIFQIGVGGTGSWVVPFLIKFLINIQQRFGERLNVRYTLIDDDIVERRNILRQNFNNEDIGRTKASVMGRRYFMNGLQIVPERLDSKKKMLKLFTNNSNFDNSLNIFLGCADNNKSRRVIYNLLKKDFGHKSIYIDSGNLLHNGQIVTISFNFEKNNTVNFLKMFPKETDGTEPTQSCAFFGDQSQSINILAAAKMFANIQRILIDGDLPPTVITFNSSGFSSFNI